MSIMKTDSANYSAIADAIRAKGVEGSWTPSQMPSAIASIKGSDGKSQKYPWGEWWDEEELYKDLRPTAWMKLPSAKQFLLDNSDYKFCCYGFINHDGSDIQYSTSRDFSFYFRDLDAKVSIGHTDENGNYVKIKDFSYDLYGDYNTKVNNFTPDIEDFVFNEETEHYELIVRILHPTTCPFGSYSAGGWSNDFMVDVDIAGTPDIAYNNSIVVPLGRAFGDCLFFNIENISPSGDNVNDALFVCQYNYSGNAILFRKNNVVYHTTNNSYGHMLGLGSGAIHKMISPGCYPCFTDGNYSSAPQIQNGDVICSFHQIKIGIRSLITSNNTNLFSLKPPAPYAPVSQFCYRPYCSGSGNVNVGMSQVLTPGSNFNGIPNLDFDIVVPSTIKWYSTTEPTNSMTITYNLGATLQTIYNVCNFVRKLHREVMGWKNNPIVISFTYEKYTYEDRAGFEAFINELAQDNITVTFRY